MTKMSRGFLFLFIAVLAVGTGWWWMSADAPDGLDPASKKTSRTVVKKGPAKPDDWFVIQRAFPEKNLDLQKFRRGAEQARELRKLTLQKEPNLMDFKWKLMGPGNIGGRVVDVAVDPQKEDTLFAAAATGGVWKSTDAGKTFETAWPEHLSQSMGALAQASDGILYAGTGEANPGGGSIVFGGSGVYRSTDEGENWEYLGLKNSGSIGRITVDPKNPKRIFVAATGPLFHAGGERGLYRSTDGGKTWDLVLEGANSTTGAVDVAMDPKNPDRIFAVMWDRIRHPDLRDYGGEGSGIYRSDDGGKTWTRLENGLPAPSDDIGRIGIGISPSDPNRLYAIVIQTDGYFQGFYISDDGGDHWTKSADDPALKQSQSSFGWWFGRIWVDPEDKNHVFVAGVPMMETKDGGETWLSSKSSTFHVDQHAMAWDPHKENRVYIGNDGGVYRSEENGSVTGKWIKSEYQPWNQFYTLAVSQQDPGRISGGTQDNGSLRSWGAEDWNAYYGGDGLANLINYQDQRIVYACYQYGNCARSEDGGDTMIPFTKETVSDRRNWLTPLVFDPNDPSIMYYGGNRLNRSEDGGKTWEVISPDLTGGPGRDAYPFGTITTISASKTDGKLLYLGTDDGRLWKTKNLGESWERIQAPNLPERWVTRVAVDPRDPDTVYATFSGFRSGENQAHVFRTKDGGETWTDLSGNLPDAPVNDLVLDPKKPNRIFVATDVGVFVTLSGGARWYPLGSGMPMVPVTDIHYHASSGTFTAATYGRGIYRMQLKN